MKQLKLICISNNNSISWLDGPRALTIGKIYIGESKNGFDKKTVIFRSNKFLWIGDLGDGIGRWVESKLFEDITVIENRDKIIGDIINT